MSICLIALGSNLGDREATLDEAIAEIKSISGVALVRHSRWYATQPVGMGEGQPEFLNGAALCETTLSPQAVPEFLQRIETRHGRQRLQRWSDRTLDLDLLLYDDCVIDAASLTIPHPRMSVRRFVLEPAAEIAGQMLHPTIGWTLERLLRHLDTGADRIAVVSPDQVLREQLAELLVRRFAAAIDNTPSPGKPADLWPRELTTWITISTANAAEHPKMTILLDPAPAGRHAAGEIEKWAVVCQQSGRGPTLRIPHAAVEGMSSEAIAAVRAVWPALGPPMGERLE